MSKQVDSSMIVVGDLSQMMKIEMPENVTPYDRASIEYTNKLLDEFFHDVVRPNAEGGKINAVWAVDAWHVYQEGKETEIMWSLRDELFPLPKEQMEYWKTVFEMPVEDMLKLGRSALLYGHEMLSLWYRRWLMETKYQSFFADPDPEKWIRKKEDLHSFEGDVKMCPLDIKKYTEKMHCVMRHVRQFKV